MSDRLMTAAELAASLRVSRRTVLRWARDGRIPTIRASVRPVLFDLAEVRRAMRHAPAGETTAPRVEEASR